MKQAGVVMKWIKWLLGIVVVLYFISGFYLVPTNELGVKRRFGRVVDAMVNPGLHYRFPYPIEMVDRIKPHEKKRISIGFEFADQAVGRASNTVQGEFLTGDNNIIQIEMVAQYFIVQPVNYLFSVASPDNLVKSMAKTALTKAIAAMGVDEVLKGSGKVAIQKAVLAETQAELDSLIQGSGRWVQVSSISLQNVFPPLEVADAFKDVAAARQDRDRLINEAQGYKLEKIPQARGESAKLSQEAQGYRTEKLNVSEGDARRFLEMYSEYKGNEQATTARLFLETMEQTMPKMQKIVLDSDSQEKPLNLKIIDLEE